MSVNYSVAGRRARLVAVLTEPGDLGSARLRGLNDVVDGLEIRADLVGDPDPRRLRRYFGGSLTYSLRSPRQGGLVGSGQAQRQARLLSASAHYDLVDLEWPDDLRPGPPAGIPPPQRRLSWRGPDAGYDGLRERFADMAAIPGALYLLAPETPDPESALAPLLLLTALRRADVTAFATGTSGTWTRILAPWLGAPVVFGRLDAPQGDGMPSVDQLVADYGFPALPRLHGLYGIAGPSPERSLSPRLHNLALRQLGLPALYLPFQVNSLTHFLQTAARLETETGLALLGLTVNAPHKEDAVELAHTASWAARGCDAANVLWHKDGGWHADTTDTLGALHALASAGVDPAGHRAAVVGCGGAGRAVALALRQAGAEVVLVNRGRARGRHAALTLGLPLVPLSRFSPRGHSVLVHATPLVEQIPFPISAADPEATVLEMVYRDPPTPLMAAARARGLRAIDGWEVLLIEAREQFRLMTGHLMPVWPARSLLPTPSQPPWRQEDPSAASVMYRDHTDRPEGPARA